jgi:hypothetical protein
MNTTTHTLLSATAHEPRPAHLLIVVSADLFAKRPLTAALAASIL